jgi:glutamyl-tRNA synthetase
MSKRTGDLALKGSRDLEPMAIASYVALIGTSDAIEPLRSMDELAARLDLSHVSTSAARFDPEDLKSLNARYLHATPFNEVADRLSERGIEGGEAFWLAVRGNISVLDEAAEWWSVVQGKVVPVAEDAAFLAKAAEVLPAEPWGETTWSEWTNAVKATTGAKGRALFHPLRLALTARESGPELKALLPLIGREKVLARLRGMTA